MEVPDAVATDMSRIKHISANSTHFLMVLLCLFVIGELKASPADTTQQKRTDNRPVQIDILSGYYEQEGNNSAVTGGEGTEELKDFATVIKINIPLKQGKDLQFDTRVSYFTSASSDNIDPRTISSASSNDVKITGNATITRPLKNGDRFGYMLGLSHEMHFMSVTGGWNYGSKTRADGSWSVNMEYIMDIWGQYYDISRLYPSDYTGTTGLDKDKRHTLATGFSFEQALNERVQVSIGTDIIQQFGLLSIPFHRILFADSEEVEIEDLPGYRLRMPVHGRLNAHVADWLVSRLYYRFYWDTFGLKAHSINMELPLKPHHTFTVYPFYRFHVQYGHDYFKGKGQHLTTDEHYTSDFDFSDLHSHFYGAGINWSPFFPNRKKGHKRLDFGSIELRGGRYTRSDGFSSWLVSGGISWTVLRKEGDENLPIK